MRELHQCHIAETIPRELDKWRPNRTSSDGKFSGLDRGQSSWVKVQAMNGQRAQHKETTVERIDVFQHANDLGFGVSIHARLFHIDAR